MKTIKYISFAISLLFLTSCDGFLNIIPRGKVIPSTLAEYRNLMNTAYGQSFNDKAICDMRTGDLIIRKVDFEQGVYGDIESWNDVKPKSSTYSFNWAVYYSVIYYANAIIAQKDAIKEGAAEDINQLVGEAYLLRAYLHFILVNLYGQPYTKPGALNTKAVPINSNTDLEKVLSRNTVGEVYDFILSDIDRARKLINKEQWENRYLYRFSTVAVDAFASRLYLYMGKWEEALKASEAVLAKKSTLEDFNAADSKLPNDFQSVEIINSYEAIQSSSTHRACHATASFKAQYTGGIDLRIAKYFGEVADDGHFRITKTDGSSQYHCTFRTGEIYLNAAEAAARKGDLAVAKTYLLKLIEKRYTPAGYTQKQTELATLSQDALITEILKERSRELAFEGHKWFDLRRTARPEIEKTLGGKTFKLSADDPRYTLRIPAEAIDANPNLAN